MGDTYYSNFITGIVVTLFLFVVLCFGFYLGTEKVISDCKSLSVTRIHETVIECAVRK